MSCSLHSRFTFALACGWAQASQDLIICSWIKLVKVSTRPFLSVCLSVCVHVHVHACHGVCVCGGQGITCRGLFFFIHHVNSRDQVQVTRLHPLNHFADLDPLFSVYFPGLLFFGELGALCVSVTAQPSPVTCFRLFFFFFGRLSQQEISLWFFTSFLVLFFRLKKN